MRVGSGGYSGGGGWSNGGTEEWVSHCERMQSWEELVNR